MRALRRTLLGLTLFASCQVYDESLLDSGSGRQTGGAPSAGGGRAGGGAGGTTPRADSGGTTPMSGGSPSTPSGGRASTGSSGSGGAFAGASATGGTASSAQGGLAPSDAGAAGAAGATGSGGEGGAPASGGEGGDLGLGAGGEAPVGSGGAPAGGADTGDAGASSLGGAPSAVESCTGCARLQVALTNQNSHAHFKLSMPAQTDLGAATITFVVRRFAGSGGRLHGFVQSGENFTFYDGVIVELADIDDTNMQSIAWDLSELPVAARSNVRYVGIQINGHGSNQYTNPTVVYVDSIRITGSSLERDYWPFDDASSIRTIVRDTCPMCVTTGQLWLDADFTAPSALLRWLGE